MFIFKNKSSELDELHQYLYDIKEDNHELAEIYQRLDDVILNLHYEMNEALERAFDD